MSKRKVKQPAMSRSQEYLKILLNLSVLHSPCVTESCTVELQHCSGCNESYPCKSRQVLDGKTVAQINQMIEDLKTITVFGDQSEEENDV